jgi:hypothetical protein
MTATEGANAKKPLISLTSGSRIRVYSAGAREEPMESTGLFRGLVSVGGDNSLAVELDEGTKKEEKGRIRLIPMNAIMAIDILRAVKVEEEKRVDPVTAAGYFR